MNDTTQEDEEEEDYMSDAFLKQIADVRPGLQKPQRPQKKVAEFPVKKTLPLTGAKLQKVKLEEGLQQALKTDNKGFSMLLKMGYKPGSGLGKKEDGRCEPIPMDVSQKRQGLGLQSAQKRKLENQTEALWKRSRQADRLRSDFRSAMSSRFRQQTLFRHVRSAQSLCQDLDERHLQLEKPLMRSFWPQRRRIEGGEGEEEEEEEEEEVEEEVYEPEELLERICEYIRTAHFYCFWCSAKYSDAEDLNSNCPGNSEDDHG